MPQRHFSLGVLLLCACSSPWPDPPPSQTVDTAPKTAAPLDVCINEFSANATASSDWIELHNPTSSGLSLAGYFLTDDADDPYKYPIDTSLFVDAGGYLLLTADGRADLGPAHLPFSLNADGETLGLFRFDGAGEQLTFGVVASDYTWSRQPDCCQDLPDCLSQTLDGTPESTNGGRR